MRLSNSTGGSTAVPPAGREARTATTVALLAGRITPGSTRNEQADYHQGRLP